MMIDMKRIFKKKRTYIILALAGLLIFGIISVRVGGKNYVEDGAVYRVIKRDVIESVEVVGTVTSESQADLAFESAGTVSEVFVDVGQTVAEGDPLVALDTRALAADRARLVATVAREQAEYEKVLSGSRTSESAVVATALQTAEQDLEDTILQEETKVENAYRTLLSSGLAAYSGDEDETAEDPIITGVYTGDVEGEYRITVAKAALIDGAPIGGKDGYAYKYWRLEQGVGPVSANSPTPLGTKGLFITFPDDTTSEYTDTTWVVEIPNKRSASYATNLNAYNLAVRQRNAAIAEAELAVSTRQAELMGDTSSQGEELRIARADLDIARADLVALDVTIDKATLRAPFDGVVTRMDIEKGELATASDALARVIRGDAFEIEAELPEIDLGKVRVGDTAEIVFDAFQGRTVTGTVISIDPAESIVDGVSVYPITLSFDPGDLTISSGMTATITIETDRRSNVFAVPLRYIVQDGSRAYVLRERSDRAVDEVDVTLGVIGSDALAEVIFGVVEGDTLREPRR